MFALRALAVASAIAASESITADCGKCKNTLSLADFYQCAIADHDCAGTAVAAKMDLKQGCVAGKTVIYTLESGFENRPSAFELQAFTAAFPSKNCTDVKIIQSAVKSTARMLSPATCPVPAELPTVSYKNVMTTQDASFSLNFAKKALELALDKTKNLLVLEFEGCTPADAEGSLVSGFTVPTTKPLPNAAAETVLPPADKACADCQWSNFSTLGAWEHCFASDKLDAACHSMPFNTTIVGDACAPGGDEAGITSIVMSLGEAGVDRSESVVAQSVTFPVAGDDECTSVKIGTAELGVVTGGCWQGADLTKIPELASLTTIKNKVATVSFTKDLPLAFSDAKISSLTIETSGCKAATGQVTIVNSGTTMSTEQSNGATTLAAVGVATATALFFAQ